MPSPTPADPDLLLPDRPGVGQRQEPAEERPRRVHLDDSENVVVEGVVEQVDDDAAVTRVDTAVAEKYTVASGKPYRLHMNPENIVWAFSPKRAMVWGAKVDRRWVWKDGHRDPVVA